MRDHTVGVRARRAKRAAVVVALVTALVAPLVGMTPASAAPGDVTTVVGGGNAGLGDGRQATDAKLAFPWGLAYVGTDLYISDNGFRPFVGGSSPFGDRLRKVDASGVISTAVGGGKPVLGDGLPATDATLNQPNDIAFDSAGNLYIADRNNSRVRRVDAVTGVITTVAGNGGQGNTGDGGKATKAQVGFPIGVVVDAAGNVYFGTSGLIRRVDSVTGRISTIAGGGDPPDGVGDNGPGTSANLNARGLALDTDGNLLITDIGNMRIRKLDLTTGIITTIAGTGGTDPAVDGALATETTAPFPEGIAVDAAGNVYFSSVVVNFVYRIDAADGTIHIVAGGGDPADGLGDGLPATEASLNFPLDVDVNAAGDVFIADLQHYRVRVVDHATGIISTYAGTGVPGFNGNGLAATETQFNRPAWLTFDPSGNLHVSDDVNNLIRRIDAATGIVTTVAGGGVGDNLPGPQARLRQPRDIAVDLDGNLLIADCGHGRLRKYDLATGIVTTVAGGGQPVGGIGDGLPATQAQLGCPSGVAVVRSGPAQGTIYIADAAQNRVRRIDPSGVITTVAGTGVAGFNGDNKPATNAQLSGPTEVIVDAAGNLYISDTGNHRVRKVDAATGRITTVAGNGKVGLGADGVPATSTELTAPIGLLLDGSGNLLIADSSYGRIRSVNLATGIITTVAGTGVPSFGGDGGPALNANFDLPTEMVFDPAGDLLLSDRANHRVRKIEGGSPPPPPPPPACGAVITADTTLTADVGPCPGDGIIVGASDITLDLAGHTVRGGGPGDGSHAGILVRNQSGVTITGNAGAGQKGIVRDFNGGVVVIGGSGNTVTNLAARHNRAPAVAGGTYGDGIVLFFSSDNLVTDNVVANNGPYDGIGLLGFGTNGNTVRGNVVENTSNLGQSAAGGVGLGIIVTPFFNENLPRGESAFDNRILNNVVRGNDNGGISNVSNVRGVIRGNTVENNGFGPGGFPFPGNGIGVSNNLNAEPDTRVLVAYNQSNDNHNAGIYVSSEGNRILHNTALGNEAFFFGADLLDTHFDCDANVWFDNTYGTADPECAAAGGHQVPGAASPATEAPTPPPPLNRPVPA